MKEGRIFYKLAKMKERKSRDLGSVKHIKSEDQLVLVKDERIKENGARIKWLHKEKLRQNQTVQNSIDMAVKLN